jgi:hypothetical protein
MAANDADDQHAWLTVSLHAQNARMHMDPAELRD